MALDAIIDYKKKLIEQNKDFILGHKESLRPSTKDLFKALSKDKAAFICEIKPASPSEGVIRKGADILEIARIYEPFASAISVLADEKFFGGSYKNVAMVSSCSSRPVLCKDVVVSPWQIYEARYYGADAALLMLSVLDDETYQSCHGVADKLNMHIITEVHSEEEMERAKRLNAKIIGINNRNLKTLQVDLETTSRLVAIAPKNALLISESGFKTREQLKKFAPEVNGFLIGTSLMRAPRVDQALRELLFGRVKICGLTNREDAEAAYALGATYGGLNFSAGSKRYVTLEEAKLIKQNVGLVWGGVFVNQSLEEVVKIARHLSLDFVQIHGDEPLEYLKDLKEQLPNSCELWRALRITATLKLPSVNYIDRILLDSFDQNHYGGTGQTFDWNILKDLPKRHEIILAGGINPSNVEHASSLAPFALDSASGVEDENPRKKSLEKMSKLFKALWP